MDPVTSTWILLDGMFSTLESTRRAAGFDVIDSRILAMAYEREFGIVLDKSSQTSNCSCRPLDAYQLEYSALNTEVQLSLHERFIALGVAPDAGGCQT